MISYSMEADCYLCYMPSHGRVEMLNSNTEHVHRTQARGRLRAKADVAEMVVSAQPYLLEECRAEAEDRGTSLLILLLLIIIDSYSYSLRYFKLIN